MAKRATTKYTAYSNVTKNKAILEVDPVLGSVVKVTHFKPQEGEVLDTLPTIDEIITNVVLTQKTLL